MSKIDRFSLTLQGLAKSGRHWDEVIPLALLADESFADLRMDSPLFGGMSWQGSLEPHAGQFVLSGSWKMQMPRKCGRCNVEFVSDVQGEVAVTYVLGSCSSNDKPAELQLEGDEAEVLAPPGILNIIDVLREHFWLSCSSMVVCSKDCKGLCLQCGVDLNNGDCECHTKLKDNPFALLKDFKFDA